MVIWRTVRKKLASSRLRGRRSISQRRVVVDDHPASIDSSKDEREIPADGCRVAVEVPAAEHESCGIAQACDFEPVEREMTHPLARGIAPFVIVLGHLPAPRGVTAGAERQLVGFPIVFHEGVDIAPIPSCRLMSEDGLEHVAEIVVWT